MRREVASVCFLTPGTYLLQSWPNWLLFYLFFSIKICKLLIQVKKKVHYVTAAVFFPHKLITVLKYSLEVCQVSKRWDYKCLSRIVAACCSLRETPTHGVRFADIDTELVFSWKGRPSGAASPGVELQRTRVLGLLKVILVLGHTRTVSSGLVDRRPAQSVVWSQRWQDFSLVFDRGARDLPS